MVDEKEISLEIALDTTNGIDGKGSLKTPFTEDIMVMVKLETMNGMKGKISLKTPFSNYESNELQTTHD
jgi:hypothetical protein